MARDEEGVGVGVGLRTACSVSERPRATSRRPAPQPTRPSPRARPPRPTDDRACWERETSAAANIRVQPTRIRRTATSTSPELATSARATHTLPHRRGRAGAAPMTFPPDRSGGSPMREARTGLTPPQPWRQGHTERLAPSIRRRRSSSRCPPRRPATAHLHTASSSWGCATRLREHEPWQVRSGASSTATSRTSHAPGTSRRPGAPRVHRACAANRAPRRLLHRRRPSP